MAASADTFAVVVDETPECAKALRYAVLRARKTAANVLVLHVLPPVQFLEWRGAQQEIEEDQAQRGRAILAEKALEAERIGGEKPETRLLRGRMTEAILDALSGDRSIRALVLGAAPKGRPGPLVSYFAGEKAGNLPFMVIVVPGGIADHDLDRLT